MPADGPHAADRAEAVSRPPRSAEAAPSRRATPKLRAYITLAAMGALAGLALALPQLVALAAPLAAYAALGLVLARPPQLEIKASVERRTVLEEEPFVVVLELQAARAIEVAELELRLQRSVSVVESGASGLLRLSAGEPRRVELSLRARRWGVLQLGSVATRSRDRFGLVEYRTATSSLGSIRAFPTRETLRALLDPLELQTTSGSRRARERGEGLEFAENRPFVPGDRLRRINWRVTAKRGTPFVAERHPELNADVILFMDTFAEVGESGGEGTLALAVRAATSLATAYLARKDRVGVVGFGGLLMGLGPRLGVAQLYRIIDALLGSEVVFSYAHKDVTFVPRGLLPPKALVIALSPLIDERSIAALLDLRARGFDLAIVEVSPEPFTPLPGSPDEVLARRLWRLQREALRTRLHELGAPAVQWRDDQPLQLPLATAAALKRHVRRPRAA